MISSVRGTLTYKSAEHVVVEVGGIGFKVFVSGSSLETIGNIGDPVFLMTYMHVREDILALYGFSTEQERKMFELLINISGVGPKAAMSILSATPLDSLYTAIALGNPEILTRIPGIGAKTAGRIVLELKGKIDPNYVPSRSPETVSADAEVFSALTNLGYSVAEAQTAIRSLPDNRNLSTEEKIVQALRYFAEHRG